jgi:hypothetical protein
MTTSGEPARDAIRQIGNWSSWHDEYENPDSELNARKRAVQTHVVAVVEACAPGPVTVVSICGGQGREVIGALENHPRRGDVGGRIVELDEANSGFAREWARRAGLDKLEVVTGDASASDSYAGLPPVDLVVISGVFGHIDRADRQRLFDFLRQICREGASVVWTYFNRYEQWTAELREDLTDRQFAEESVEVLDGDYAFVIGRNRFAGATEPFTQGMSLFTFGSSRK